MKTWILSSDSEIPSTKRLLVALRKSKFETEVLNPAGLQFEFGHRGIQILHLGKKKQLPDLALLRLGWRTLEQGLRVGRFLESAGVRVLNSSDSFSKAADKLASLQIFHFHNLPVPQTRFADCSAASELHLFSRSQQHVFKTLQGSQGFGVTWQKDRLSSRAQIDSFRNVKAPVLVQELIEESFGEDIRAFVLQGEVVAAMKRQAPAREMRSNLHQSGRARKVTLSAEEKELALKAAASLDLFYSGVDFLRTRKGPLLLEANPSPGFEGISSVSRKDVALLFAKSLRDQLA